MAFGWLPFAGNVLDSAFKLGSTKSQVHGATNAASEIEKYNREAQQNAMGIYNQGRGDLFNFNLQGRDDITAGNNKALGYLQPYYQTGVDSMDTLANETRNGGSPLNRAFTLQDFQASPGYEFARGEGQRGIQSSAAAKGGVLGGGTLKALSRFNEGLASGEFNNERDAFTGQQDRRFGQLFGLGQLGAQAGTQAANLSQQAGSQLGNMAQQTGEASFSQSLPLAQLTGGYIQNIGDANAGARLARGSAYGNFYNSLNQNAQTMLNQVGPKIGDWFKRKPYNPV